MNRQKVRRDKEVRDIAAKMDRRAIHIKHVTIKECGKRSIEKQF
jgi:hypothetical protein